MNAAEVLAFTSPALDALTELVRAAQVMPAAHEIEPAIRIDRVRLLKALPATFGRARGPANDLALEYGDRRLRIAPTPKRAPREGVPNLFRSPYPPPEPWKTINEKVRAFLARAPAHEREDLYAEVLARLAAAFVEFPPENADFLAGYAIGIARRVVASALEEARLERDALARFTASKRTGFSRATPDGSVDLVDRDAAEDELIFEAEEARAKFWRVVHAWCAARCRERFGGRTLYLPKLKNVTRSALADPKTRVDGREITPEVAALLRLLRTRVCPADVTLLQASGEPTSPEDVYQREREAMKKAFQRARSVPGSQPRLPITGQR